jgi:hypothetical protein
VGRLSRWSTTWITSLEMTSVAGVSGAVCAICRNQSRRMAVGVRMASRLHMASTGGHAAIFQQTARFENLVEIFDEPSPLVPGHALPRLLCGRDGDGGDQDPFEGFDAFRWLGLPHPDHRCRKRRHGERRPVGGWLDGYLLPRDLDQGFPLGASTPGLWSLPALHG